MAGVYLAPTLVLDKSQVKQGDKLVISGQGSMGSTTKLLIDGGQTLAADVVVDSQGRYEYLFDTTSAPKKLYEVTVQGKYGTAVSGLSPMLHFTVGDSNLDVDTTECGRADLNCDGKVSLVDFAIAGFWYKQTLSPVFAQIELERLNGDGKIDLVDFAIMAFYWTG